MDLYKKTQRNLRDKNVREPSTAEMLELAAKMFVIAKHYGMNIQTCAEEIALESVGIQHGKCIDIALIEDLLGVKLVASKDPNQRKECGCVQSIDIGEYNTCAHGCKYCYANFREDIVVKNKMAHDPDSPLLIGHLIDEDKVTERKLFSFIKVPEPFKVGDIVKVKHPEQYRKSSDIYAHNLNLYKISSMGKDTVRLDSVEGDVPNVELLPVAIDGVEDRWIYFDPQIAAFFDYGDGVPTSSRDYSYYMDAFERSCDGKKTYKEMIEKSKLKYVHEVQHWLWKKYQDEGLKINEWKH